MIKDPRPSTVFGAQSSYWPENEHSFTGNRSEHFVVKIAGSSKFGNNGAMLVFDVESCELKAILQDKGFLTTLRTAIAGVICLMIMPWTPQNIGIIGSGSLAGQLYELARTKYPKANIWPGPTHEKIKTSPDAICLKN